LTLLLDPIKHTRCNRKELLLYTQRIETIKEMRFKIKELEQEIKGVFTHIDPVKRKKKQFFG